MTRRPRWWPEALWPGAEEGSPAHPGEGTLRREAGPRRRGPPEDPADSFLRALGLACGAEAVLLYRLEREPGCWRLVRRWSRDGRGPEERGVIDAAGHPLTWCHREDLVVQVTTDEMLEGTRGGWSVAGPVPGSGHVLVARFPGNPPQNGRAGVGAALDHLGALADAGHL